MKISTNRFVILLCLLLFQFNCKTKHEKPENFTQIQIIGNYAMVGLGIIEINTINDSLYVVQNGSKFSHKIIKRKGNTYEIPNDSSIQFVFSKLKDNHSQILTIFQNGDKTTCNRTLKSIKVSQGPLALVANSEKEIKYLAEPFLGITTDGEPIKNLFSIKSTGISTKPIQIAVNEFLASLSEKQKEACRFPIDDNEWRRWHNVEIYNREGIALFEMDDNQKSLAFNILNESLSAKGLKKAKDIMTMEAYLKELSIKLKSRNIKRLNRLGNDKYYFTFMGEPSDTEPWGWQIDGHHLAINYFVLGDQVVMTPTFMGSEPNFIKEGKNKGLRTFEEEENKGLNFYKSLDASQKELATLWNEKKYGFSQAEAFRDNEVIPYSGIQAKVLNESQKISFLKLIEEYISRMRPEHAKIKMNEIKAHINDTWFCWIGGSGEDDPFYYRIQSPVIMIEFDHHSPVFIREKGKPSPGPVKWHVHTVVRTPNGNDYGKDLLRQHLENHHH